MGRRTYGAIIACALACLVAACGSSGHTRTSLINASVPTTASTATTASTPGTLTLGEKVPNPSALPEAGTASTITPTGPTATSATTARSPASAPAPKAVAVPSTGPLNAAQFESAANTICLGIDNKARAIGGAGTTASESAATKLEALEVLSQRAVTALQALAPRGSAASQKKDAAFVKQTKKEIAIGTLAEQDAQVGDQSAYGKELDQLSVISGPVITAGKALAPACAQG
jgi:hypothetical protein